MPTEDLIRSVLSALREKGIVASDETIKNSKQEYCSDFNDVYILETSNGKRVFVKTRASCASMSLRDITDMFEGEFKGLQAMRSINTIRVPQPYATGTLDNGRGAFIAMEFIELDKHDMHNPQIQHKLGTQLAKMHLAKGPDKFGFEINNTIGITPQDNTWNSSWIYFLRKRLLFQLELAERYDSTALKNRCIRLIDGLEQFFEGIEVQPSLLHGDLWAGNYSADKEGNPVIFDPAVYWGHHEAELSIMRLFGGFSQQFYDAYHALIPKAPGFDMRLRIYTLYHVLNHLNLFGREYLGQCLGLLDELGV